MPAEFDDAIVIRLWDWSETSQTVAALTRRHGVIRGLAKGSKRPKHPFSGGLEVLTRGELGFIAKPTTELAVLTEWDLGELFPTLRTNLRCHYAGLYAADLVHHLLQPRDPHPELFDELIRCLHALTSTDAAMPALARFQWALLHHAGYRPALGEATMGDLAFHPRLGEVRALRGAESEDSDGEPSGPSWRVRASTVAVLRSIRAAVDAGAASTGSLAGEAEPTRRAAKLLATYIRFLLDQHLPSSTMVFPDLRAAAT